MASENLARYKAALLDMQAAVAEQLDTITAQCKPVEPDQALGRLTRNDAMQSQQLALHQRDRLLAQQTRIKGALERVDAGTYGTCLSCKQPIDPRRLDAAPDSPLCVACIEQYQANRNSPR